MQQKKFFLFYFVLYYGIHYLLKEFIFYSKQRVEMFFFFIKIKNLFSDQMQFHEQLFSFKLSLRKKEKKHNRNKSIQIDQRSILFFVFIFNLTKFKIFFL